MKKISHFLKKILFPGFSCTIIHFVEIEPSKKEDFGIFYVLILFPVVILKKIQLKKIIILKN